MGYLISAVGGTGTGTIYNGVSTVKVQKEKYVSKTDRATTVDIESIDSQYDARFIATNGDFY